MNHSEYIRISDNPQTAVFMIHGIAGTPAHFRDLIPLIPEEWSVYNILLDGHGMEVRDFGAASMKKWKDQVERQFCEIARQHERIIFVTHSMGGLFATQLAITYPDKVAQLFLLVLPLKAFIRPVTVISSLKIMLGMVKAGADKQGTDGQKAMYRVSKIAQMMVDDCSIRLTGRFWEYIPWVFPMIELLWEMRKTRRMIHRLEVPCETYQSRQDELVSMRSCSYLEGHPYIRNTVMNNSGHFGYEGEDREILLSRFREMVERWG